MASFGANFTGQNDEEQPLKNIVSGAGPALNRAIFDDPASRAALLQIGLGLMQPMAIGQGFSGHLAQGIGGGGELVSRLEESDLKRELGESKIAELERRNDIAQQRADTYAARAEQDQSTGITATLQRAAEQKRRDDAIEKKKARDKQIAEDAKQIHGEVNTILKDKMLPPGYEDYERFRGKTPRQIREMLTAEEEAKYGPIEIPDYPTLKPTIRGPRGAAPATAAPAVPAAPLAGARKGADGNMYVPDPNRPGKWMKVVDEPVVPE